MKKKINVCQFPTSQFTGLEGSATNGFLPDNFRGLVESMPQWVMVGGHNDMADSYNMSIMSLSVLIPLI